MSRDHSAPATFFVQYLHGKAQASEIDDFIDFWHRQPNGRPLHEFLGMTEAEYARWTRDPDILPEIADARREG